MEKINATLYEYVLSEFIDTLIIHIESSFLILSSLFHLVVQHGTVATKAILIK